VLSGLLFIIYVNILTESFTYQKTSLYADDAKLYAPIKNEKSYRLIQEDLNALAGWCKSLRMKLNVSKCFFSTLSAATFYRRFSSIFYRWNTSKKGAKNGLLRTVNPFKPAGIYASHRFRGACVGKVCIIWNFKDRFPSFFA